MYKRHVIFSKWKLQQLFGISFRSERKNSHPRKVWMIPLDADHSSFKTFDGFFLETNGSYYQMSLVVQPLPIKKIVLKMRFTIFSTFVMTLHLISPTKIRPKKTSVNVSPTQTTLGCDLQTEWQMEGFLGSKWHLAISMSGLERKWYVTPKAFM